ncbi:hypothetical protein ACJJTC_002765 [Scirpophaga incertulas]
MLVGVFRNANCFANHEKSLAVSNAEDQLSAKVLATLKYDMWRRPGCGVHIKLYIIASICNDVLSDVKEPRKVGLLIPEKIIGGVIDIVHNHKNKPQQGSFQQTQVQSQQGYQPAPGYQPQYPSYPQYPPMQNQGNYQSQYQSQYQQQYGYQPQNGNYASNYPQGGYPVPAHNQGSSFQGQNQQSGYGGQSQGQYQSGYPQNQGNQYQSQNQQPTSYPSGQYQPTGQYQGSQNQQTVNYQGSQGQQVSNVQGPNQQASQNQASQFQLQGQGSSSMQSGGFQVSGGSQSGGPGPTCVCQAWTKPEPTGIQDPTAQKVQEKSEDDTTKPTE